MSSRFGEPPSVASLPRQPLRRCCSPPSNRFAAIVADLDRLPRPFEAPCRLVARLPPGPMTLKTRWPHPPENWHPVIEIDVHPAETEGQANLRNAHADWHYGRRGELRRILIEFEVTSTERERTHGPLNGRRETQLVIDAVNRIEVKA